MMPDIKTPGAVYAPYDPGVIARAAMGLRYLFTGQPAAQFFGPGEPMAPVAPVEVQGREFDYPFAHNLVPTVRSGELISMMQLRQLAETWDLLRTVIESCKDQVSKLKWTIKDDKEEEDQESIDFFSRPSSQYEWDTWLRILLEDLFVLDAPTLYVNFSRGGEILSFDPIDGGTIKPLIDPWGRRPLEGPAYQQMIKGLPAVEYTREQLVYYPRNPRAWKVYGYGPVEQILVTINIALRRQEFQLCYYKDGSAPNMMIQAPEGFTFAQIKEFRTYLIDLLSGNAITRNQGLVIPHGSVPVDTKAMILKDEYDEWLARLVCFAFSVPPQPFIKEINRATAETARAIAESEGIVPRMKWVERLINDCQRRRGKKSKFSWVMDEVSLAPKEQAEVDQIYINAGVLGINEVRERMGLEAKEEPEPEVPLVVAVPGKEEPPPVPEKAAKAKRLAALRRDRPGLLLKEARYQADLVKAFYRMSRSLAPKIAEEFGLPEKVDAALDAKLKALVDAEDWGALHDLMTKHGIAMYQFGAASAAEQLSVVKEMLNLVNEDAVAWAAENAASKVKDIAEATMESIRSMVVQSKQEGWGSKRLADAILDDWGFSPARCETIARTEGAYADVQGSIALYKRSGQVARLQFLAADTAPCDICDDMNGAEFEMGDLEKTPPIHPNCRCAALPILTEKE